MDIDDNLDSVGLEKAFNLSVELIKSLPEKGSVQPSYAEAAKIYSYFKQSKFGPCTNACPGFWEPVNRAKWEAWNTLGNMPKHQAMREYVSLIKGFYSQSMETDDFETDRQYSHVLIPYCQAVGIPLSATLTKIHNEQLKKKSLPVDEKCKKDSPIETVNEGTIPSNKDELEQLNDVKSKQIESVDNNKHNTSDSGISEISEKQVEGVNKMSNDDNDEEDVFSDPLTPEEFSREEILKSSSVKDERTENATPERCRGCIEAKEINLNILNTLKSMENNVQLMNQRLQLMEANLQPLVNQQASVWDMGRTVYTSKSIRTIAWFLWPVVVNFLFSFIKRRRRKQKT